MPTAAAIESSSSAREMEDHAERLRGLEGSYSEVASQLAAQSVQIDGQSVTLERLEQTVDRGVSELGQRIEDLAKPLITRVEKIADDVEEHGRRLLDLQKFEDDRAAKKDDRRKTIKRLALGVGLAGGGVLGKELTMWVLAHFHLIAG